MGLEVPSFQDVLIIGFLISGHPDYGCHEEGREDGKVREGGGRRVEIKGGKEEGR